MTGLFMLESVALSGGFIFKLDMQLLFDILFQGIAVFLLAMFLSYVLIEPVKKVLRDRQAKIKSDIESAANDREEAARLKAEYDEKIANVDSEADAILADARKRAIKNENNIINEAKKEAERIVTSAEKEIELEKLKVKDDVRVEIINVASAMAGKIVTAEIDEKKQKELIDDTLKELGGSTWLND